MAAGETAPHAVARDDAQLATKAYRTYKSEAGPAHRRGLLDMPIAVETGDVLRTLGIAGQRPPGRKFIYPFDLGVAKLDGGKEIPFVAHVIARNFFWSGQFIAAMNVGWFGELYLGPRSHPNDGQLDITNGLLTLQQRVIARKRASSGTHLPHEGLTVKRTPAWQIELDRKTAVFVDGQRIGSHRRIELNLVADAFSVIA